MPVVEHPPARVAPSQSGDDVREARRSTSGAPGTRLLAVVLQSLAENES